MRDAQSKRCMAVTPAGSAAAYCASDTSSSVLDHGHAPRVAHPSKMCNSIFCSNHRPEQLLGSDHTACPAVCLLAPLVFVERT